MTDLPTELSGHCSCGAITYRAAAAPLMQAVCHCKDCQRQSGTAFSIVVAVPRDALTIDGDKLSVYKTVGEMHNTETERHFCSDCGSPIVSYSAGSPELAFIKAGTLDDISWFEPMIEVWTRSAHAWSPHFEGVAQVERMPG